MAVLAAATGTSAVIASVREAVVGRPLPYRAPAELVTVRIEAGPPGAARGSMPYPFGHEILLMREEASAFAWMGSWSAGRANLGTGRGTDDARMIRFARLSPGLLEMLGVHPSHGRWFVADEYLGAAPSGLPAGSPAGGPRVLLLSHRLWRTAFGGSLEVVDREVTVDERPARVIGIMPPDFAFPDTETDVWAPTPGPEPKPSGGSFTMTASPTVARLRPGWSASAAGQEATALLAGMGERRNPSVRLESLADAATASIRPTLEILQIGALFLVLAAALSVTGLRVSRAVFERRASAIRRCLGADWRDETSAAAVRVGVLGAAVALAGWLVALWLLPVLGDHAGNLRNFPEWSLSRDAALRGLAVALVATVIAELPSLFGWRRSPSDLARRGISSAAGPRPLARVFLGFGVAIVVSMLIAAAVFAGSAWRLVRGAYGYDDAGLAQISVDFAGRGGASLPFSSRIELLDRLSGRLGTLAGVRAVGYADTLPDEMQGNGWRPSGIPLPEGSYAVSVGRRRAVSPTLFAALGMPILRGRGFSDSDRTGAEAVAVLDLRAASLSDRADPLGQPERAGSGVVRVVGIVPEARLFARREAMATLYVPFAQRSEPGFGLHKAEVVVRFDEAPSAERLAALSRFPAEVSPALRALRTESVRDRRVRALGSPVFAAAALIVFSATGLLLAAAGAVSHVLETVAQNRYSIAVRRALGAPDRRVVKEVVWRTALAAGVGIVAGAGIGWVAVRFLSSRVLWVEAGRAAFYAGPVAFLAAIILGAAWCAGRRALRDELGTVLRSE